MKLYYLVHFVAISSSGINLLLLYRIKMNYIK